MVHALLHHVMVISPSSRFVKCVSLTSLKQGARTDRAAKYPKRRFLHIQGPVHVFVGFQGQCESLKGFEPQEAWRVLDADS